MTTKNDVMTAAFFLGFPDDTPEYQEAKRKLRDTLDDLLIETENKVNEAWQSEAQLLLERWRHRKNTHQAAAYGFAVERCLADLGEMIEDCGAGQASQFVELEAELEASKRGVFRKLPAKILPALKV